MEDPPSKEGSNQPNSVPFLKKHIGFVARHALLPIAMLTVIMSP